MIEKLLTNHSLASILMSSLRARGTFDDEIASYTNEAVITRLREEATARLRKGGYGLPWGHHNPLNPSNPYDNNPFDQDWGNNPLL
jgi:hypothetical protein